MAITDDTTQAQPASQNSSRDSREVRQDTPFSPDANSGKRIRQDTPYAPETIPPMQDTGGQSVSQEQVRNLINRGKKFDLKLNQFSDVTRRGALIGREISQGLGKSGAAKQFGKAAQFASQIGQPRQPLAPQKPLPARGPRQVQERSETVITESNPSGEPATAEVQAEVEVKDPKFQREIQTIQKAVRIGQRVARLAGQEGIASALGEVGGVADAAQGPGVSRQFGANQAGKYAAKKSGEKLGEKIGQGGSQALGGAVAGALGTEGGVGDKAVGAAVGAANWYVVDFFYGLLFTGVWTIPAMLYLDLHWVLSKFEFSGKLFKPLFLWQKIVLALFHLVAMLIIVVPIIAVLYAGCSSLGIFAKASSMCRALESMNLTVGGQDNTISPSNINGPSVKVGNTCYAAASGPASVASLTLTCFGSNADKASAIAFAESGGNPLSESKTDRCTGGEAVSIGLYQINISAHNLPGLNCTQAFDHMFTASQKCTVINQNLYQQCVQAAKDAGTNIQAACQISGNGANWNAWGANQKCGF